MVLPEANNPGEHHDPPISLNRIDLPLLTTLQSWFRLHRSHHEPVHFGRTQQSRFDAPGGEFGVLYAASDPFGAFAETISLQSGARRVTWSVVSARSLARIDVVRPLRLVDLTGPGLIQIGADGRLTTDSHRTSQRWAHAFWQHPSEPDGVVYRARRDPSRVSVALFERSRPAIQAVRMGTLTDHHLAELLNEMLAAYRIRLVDDR